MIPIAEVVVGMDVSASPGQVWAALTDWGRQGEWILATTVRQVSAAATGLGTEVEAFTGIGRLGVRDTMRVSEWDPPRRCTVRHTGRLIRGLGIFEVTPRPRGSRFTWTETLQLPFGALGRAGWVIAKPLVRAGIQHSVKRFVIFAQSYPAPERA